MRGPWVLGLLLSLGSLAARAEEVTWHSAGSPPSSLPQPSHLPAVWHTRGHAEPELLDEAVQQAALLSTSDEPPLADSTSNIAPPAKGRASAGPAVTVAQSPAEALPPPQAVPSSASDNPFRPIEGEVSELPGEPAGPARPRFEAGADYLYWWVRSSRLPPLVTSSPATLPEASRGVLGPNTTVLAGNQSTDEAARSGGRLTAAYWLDPDEGFAFEAGGFFLSQVSTTFNAGDKNFPVLARPVFNLNRGVEDRFLVASPGTVPGDTLSLKGRVSVEAPSQLWGAELGLRRTVLLTPFWRVEVLGGARYVNLEEGLHIDSSSQSLADVPGAPAYATGNTLSISDRFDTHNQFYGGQVGARVEWHLGPWAVAARAQVALGLTHEVIEIAGSQTVTGSAGLVQQIPTGLLAQDSNSGHSGRDRFAVIPEAGLRLSYDVTEMVRVFVGYDGLFWSNVVRPGDQVERTLDMNRVANFLPAGPPNLTGRPAPLVPFRESSFWAQGVSCGLEVRY